MAAIPSPLRSVFDDVQRVAGWLWERGWAERNAGNLSVDVTDFLAGGGVGDTERLAGRSLLVSAAGSRFRDIARDPTDGMLLVTVRPETARCHVVWDPSERGRRPTSELSAHLAIHAELRERASRPGVVLHTHPTHLIALNHSGIGTSADELTHALWAILPEVKVVAPDGIGLAPYRLPGSTALAEATVVELRHHRAVIWDKHGILVVESSVIEAFDLIDVLDKAAGLYLTCLAAGYRPRGLSAKELTELDGLVGPTTSGT